MDLMGYWAISGGRCRDYGGIFVDLPDFRQAFTAADPEKLWV
jgi:hypothetical protein